jgi:hypothetical protein
LITGRYRPLSAAQKQVNAAHARQRGPGERANAELKNWRIFRKIRCCPTRTTTLSGSKTRPWCLVSGFKLPRRTR